MGLKKKTAGREALKSSTIHSPNEKALWTLTLGPTTCPETMLTRLSGLLSFSGCGYLSSSSWILIRLVLPNNVLLWPFSLCLSVLVGCSQASSTSISSMATKTAWHIGWDRIRPATWSPASVKEHSIPAARSVSANVKACHELRQTPLFHTIMERSDAPHQVSRVISIFSSTKSMATFLLGTICGEANPSPFLLE